MVAKCFILLCSIITIASFAHGQDLYTLGKCALKDSDCHKEKIENFLQYYSDAGIPELDIGPLDPYHFNNVSISKKRVDFTIKNGILKGIKKCQVNYFRLFIEKGKAILDVTCDFTVEGQYKVHSDNTIFNFIAGGVIHGDGNLKLNADKLNIKIYYYFALRKQNGQIYIKGKEDRSHYVFNVQDRVAVVINNIYIGNQESTDYITPCSRNDPNLNECALKSAKQSIHQFSLGDEDRHLPALDPVYVEEMTVYIPNENGLKLVFKDNYFHGLSGMELENLKFDFNKKIITTEALINLEVANKYDLSGKLMIVPIKSNGDSFIKLKNTDLKIKMWYEHVTGADGKIHWNITKHDIKYDVEKAMFRLENLLGDKNIGDQINNLLNEMWKEVVADVGPFICHSLSSAVVKNIGVFLDQVSFDELFPE